MNWKSTLLLVLVAGAAVAAVWKGDEWGRKAGVVTAPPPADTASTAAIRDHFPGGKITRVEIAQTDPNDPFVLEQAGDAEAGWKLPGNWPLRKPEVEELVGTLAGLRTRFQPADLTAPAAFGLAPAQNPLVVKVTADGTPYTLTFGELPPVAGESAFTRPAYLRVNDNPEVLRLGPDVLPVLRRPADYYRKRQIFPDAERIRLAGGSPQPTFVPLLADKVAAVEVRGPANEYTVWGAKVKIADGEYTLRHTEKLPTPVAAENNADPVLTAAQVARTWELEKPVRDRVDPDRLRTVLAAVPDLWADQFVRNTDQAFALADLLSPVPTILQGATGVAIADHVGREAWFLKRTGLDKPERAVSVVRQTGEKITVRFGGVGKATVREEPPPPPRPGMPPFPPRTVVEEYRFAKLDHNPLVFLVKADKLADVFARPSDLKDPRLARFETNEVQEFTVAVKGKPPVKLTRKKGNPKADKPEDRDDRWYLDRQPAPVLAETAKVTELLDQLGRLEARGRENLVTAPDLKAFDIDPAGTTVTLVVRDRRADDLPPAPERKVVLQVGKPDADAKKLPVLVAGWGRVNLVDDAVLKLIDREAVAYRGRKLFDTAELTLTTVGVQPAGGEAFEVAKAAADAPWKLTRPLARDADREKAQKLADDLARLEAVEFVAETPSADDLKKYGLDAPKRSAALTFTGPNAAPQKLELGADREGKPEVYARLNGGGTVFAVPKTLADSLDKGAVALLPPEVWKTTPDAVTSLKLERGAETYSLAKDGFNWKLSGPFDAPVSFLSAQPLLTALSDVKAEKYEAISAADPAKYGFDKPALKLTLGFTGPKEKADAPAPAVVKVLVVGKPADGSPGRYARLDGPGPQPVFVLPEAVAAEADRPALDLLDRSLLVLDPGRITKLQIAGPKPEDNVTLAKADKGWKAEGATFAVDGPTVARLADTFARLPVKRLAGYGPAVKWADYGLEKPEYTITATLAGDKPEARVLKLGKKEPSGDRFARVDDGPAVGVVPGPAVPALAVGKLEFVDRTLLTFDPAMLSGLTRTGGTELEILPGAAVGWDITRPAKQKADQQLVEDLADQLGRLRAERVAAHGPKDIAAKFGLDKPAATVTVKVGDKPTEKVLKIGNPVDAAKPDGERFAMAEAGGPEVTVGVIAAPLAKRLLAPPIGFRDRSLAKFVDADKLTLQRGDRKVTFAKEGGTWKVTDPVKAEAEQADLDDLVNALAKLSADELVADKPADTKPFGLDKPEAKWVVSDKGKDVLTLLVGGKEKGGERVYGKLETGDVVGLLSAPLTQKVLGEYRRRKVWDGVDAAQADSLVVSAGAGTFHLRKQGPGWIDLDKPGDPLSVPAVVEVLDALAGLKAARYVADKDADLKLYGLEKPERVVVLTQQGGITKTLQIGREVGGTGGKQVYAKVRDADRTDVFVLSEADTAKLLRDRAAFTAKKP